MLNQTNFPRTFTSKKYATKPLRALAATPLTMALSVSMTLVATIALAGCSPVTLPPQSPSATSSIAPKTESPEVATSEAIIPEAPTPEQTNSEEINTRTPVFESEPQPQVDLTKNSLETAVGFTHYYLLSTLYGYESLTTTNIRKHSSATCESCEVTIQTIEAAAQADFPISTYAFLPVDLNDVWAVEENVYQIDFDGQHINASSPGKQPFIIAPDAEKIPGFMEVEFTKKGWKVNGIFRSQTEN